MFWTENQLGETQKNKIKFQSRAHDLENQDAS
jgi:hypothetical protein